MKKIIVIGMVAFLLLVTPNTNVTASEGFVYGTLENVFGIVDEDFEECFNIINIQIGTGDNESIIVPLKSPDTKQVRNFDQHSIDTLKFAVGYEISIQLEEQILIYVDGNKDGILEGTLFREIERANHCELSYYFLEGEDLPNESAINFRVKSEIGTTTASGFLIISLLAIPIVRKVRKRKNK